jgi:AcrR family transcriptional regulator
VRDLATSHRSFASANTGSFLMSITTMSAARPAASSSSRSEERIDRRRLRSARTRQAIIEAYLSLARESQQIPTSTRIAERAGCSVRSIFERFPDLHALRVAATDFTFVQAAAQVLANEPRGDRANRIKVHVESRGQVCEYWLPLWRALIMNQGNSRDLKTRIEMVREAILKRIEMVYQPELAGLSERERHHVLITIDSLIDFESWAHMREGRGLSFDEACAVWRYAIDRLLPPTPVS